MAFDTVNYMTTKNFIKMAYDTANTPTVNNGITTKGKIPISIMHIGYYKLKDEISDSNLIGNYFIVDPVDNVFYDKPNRTDEPYIYKTAFSAAGMAFNLKTAEPTFVLDNHWIVKDSSTQHYYNDPKYLFKVNFDDGNGSVYYSTNSRHEIEIDYTDNERVRIVKLEIVDTSFPNDSVVAGVSFRLRSPAFYPALAGSRLNQNGMNILVIEGCGSEDPQRIKKTAVIVGGISLDGSSTPDIVWQRVANDTKIAELRNHGYEFHVIAWENSLQRIETNAFNLISYMDELKCDLINLNGEEKGEPLVVIGYSLGGVIANYALSFWENNPGISSCDVEALHFTRLFVSMDAPATRGKYSFSVSTLI